MLWNLFLFLFLFVVVFPHRRSESNKRLIILPPSFIVALSAATNPPTRGNNTENSHFPLEMTTSILFQSFWHSWLYFLKITLISALFQRKKFLCDKMLLLEKRRWLSSGSVITAMIAAMSFLRWLWDVFYVPSIMWRSFTRRHLCDALIALMTVMGGGDLGFLWLLPHIWGFQRRHTFPLCLVIAGTSSS